MKILFLADNFPPEKNAQASRVYERACYWQAWGHAVSVLTCCPNFPEGRVYSGFKNRVRQVSIMDGIRVIRVITFIAANRGRIRRITDFISFMVSAIVMGIFEKRPDLVVATSPQFFAAIAGWILSVIHRVPFVMELSDLWPDSIVAVGAMKKSVALAGIEKLELFLYRRAKRVVALTESFKKNLIRRGIPAGKIDVVINGVDLSRYSPRSRDDAYAQSLGLSPGHFVIGYVGTLGLAHGLVNVLEAAARTNDPRIRYLLVGPGAEREQLLAKAAEMNLRNVIIAPSQPKEKMPAVWSICNVALVHLKNTPLFQTVIPSKMFEAMAMGLPILLSIPEGEASAIVARERCGISIAPQDPDALATAANFMATNPAELRYFGEQSRLSAPAYSRERQARDMIRSLAVAIGEEEPILEKKTAAVA